MKSLAILVVALLINTLPARAGGPVVHATVSGTVTIGKGTDSTSTKIKMFTLDNKGLCAQFGESSKDYAVVFDGINSQIALEPKSLSSGKTKIVVCKLTNFQIIADTGKKVTTVAASLSSVASGNVFENLAGVLAGTRMETTGPAPQKMTLRLIATGKNPDPTVLYPLAVLRLKIVTGALFTAAP